MVKRSRTIEKIRRPRFKLTEKKSIVVIVISGKPKPVRGGGFSKVDLQINET
jgi:hypothetical protein